jgi:uncharacterized protein (TIGR03437 family)
VAVGCAGQTVNFQSHYIRLGTQDSSVAMAADAGGNLFIVSELLDATHNSSVRVTKADPMGNVVASLDFGPGVKPYAVAVDPQGNVVVAGNGLVAKLDNALANILATSTIGGTAVTTDASGNVWVAGGASASFPTTTGAYESNPPAGSTYAFVAELSPDLSQVMAATLYGSSSADCNAVNATCRQGGGPGLPAMTVATAIALDPYGAVLMAGQSNGIPAQLGVEPYNYGFAVKFSPDLTTLLAQTTYNPAQDTATSFAAMALDAQGNVIVAGQSAFAGSLAGGLQPDSPQSGGGIVMKFDNNLNSLWATYFGTGVAGAAVDGLGDLWITGTSRLDKLPGSPSTSTTYSPFVAELTPDGSSVMNLVTSVFGGNAVTALPASGVAVLSPADSFLLTAAADQPSLLLVANSANNQSSGTIAPAELISLYGSGIGPAAALGGQVVNDAFTNNLGGYQVLFNGIAAPLLYAGPNQMNVVAPVELGGQATANIQVVGPMVTTSFPTVFVGAARPQLFSQVRPVPIPHTNATGSATFAIAYNQDGSLNSTANPAALGSIVTLWLSGTGLNNDPLADGAIAATASTTSLPIAIQGMQVLYGGQAPGAVQGLTQVNVQIPTDAFIFGPTQVSLYLQQGDAMAGIAVIEVTTNE